MPPGSKDCSVSKRSVFIRFNNFVNFNSDSAMLTLTCLPFYMQFYVFIAVFTLALHLNVSFFVFYAKLQPVFKLKLLSTIST